MVYTLSIAQIDTDRPAYTNSVNTIAPQNLQLEGGLHSYFFKYGAIGDDLSISLPNTMVRLGLSDNAEFRLEIPSINYLSIQRDTFEYQGLEFDNLSFGVKSKLYKAEKLNVSSILTLFFMEQGQQWIAIPLSIGVDVNFPFSYALSSNSSLAGSVSLNLIDGFTRFGSSFLYGRYIQPKLWVQAEYFNNIWYYNLPASNEKFYLRHNANLSAQYTISERCKADFTMGSLLHSDLGIQNIFNTPNIRTEIGLAYLLYK
ncbi:MAG: hypothetical protein RLZZ337_793 [Bacteroidota bacterium]|jgi:hypothetical protein